MSVLYISSVSMVSLYKLLNNFIVANNCDKKFLLQVQFNLLVLQVYNLNSGGLVNV